MKGSIAFPFSILLFAANLSAADIPGFVTTQPAGVRSVKLLDGRYMVPYTVKLTDEVSFEMIPIPGGKFKLGSPATEKNHNSDTGSGRSDEGPQAEVEIEPFWMGKCEVTWGELDEWLRYMYLFKEDTNSVQEKARKNAEKFRVDAVTAPSTIYDETYPKEWGKNPKLPAITMSQFSARQYTKWLSKLTGQIYCLPNEAEWEYACRAGTATSYYSGDDPRTLEKYEWTEENAKEQPHPVGQKLANPWGLHDMHGNVMEWTLDAYSKDGYQRLAVKSPPNVELTNWPTKLFPRVLRGGSFEFTASNARSAARFASDDNKLTDNDADRLKSPWWLTDDPARSIGFRIIRPLRELPAAHLEKCWEADNNVTKEAVEEYLKNGRGGLGVVEPDPEVKTESPAKR